MNNRKPKLAMYWAASCGGCEISLANIHEVILELDEHFDFFFCPCLLDTKKADIDALPDGAISVTFFNGALRTEENKEMAQLLRRKSQLFIAFGSCAAGGGIPALANHHGTQHLMDTVFQNAPCLDNPEGTTPQPVSRVADGELHLPLLLPCVLSAKDAVKVDYTMPGCPPEPEQIVALIRHLAAALPLPSVESMPVCTERAVCDQCTREKKNLPAPCLQRPSVGVPEPGWCLLEQGYPCLGSATRAGCNALCPAVNMHCTGCYGAIDLTSDPGAAALAAMAAVIRPAIAGQDEAAIHSNITTAMNGLPDPLGSLYRYSLANAVTAVCKREASQ